MSYNPRGAALWRRVLAPLLDVVTLGYGSGYLLALLAGKTSGYAFHLSGAPAAAWFALLGLYFFVGWRYAGGTLWDRLLGVGRPQPEQRRRDPRPRASVWRRTVALAIDGLIVTVLFQIVVAALFAATDGRVQMYGDLRMSTCTVQSPAPAARTVVRECTVSLLGLPVAKRREVARPGEDSPAISAELIDAEGRPLERLPVDWIALLALIVYLFAMEARSGATLGSRAMGICVIDAVSGAAGVPWPKLARRYGAMLLGLVPTMAVLLGTALLSPSDVATTLRRFVLREDAIDVFSVGTKFRYTPAWADPVTWAVPDVVPGLLSEAVGIVLVYWILFLLVQIARKEDPVYDTVAGTAVVRVGGAV